MILFLIFTLSSFVLASDDYYNDRVLIYIQNDVEVLLKDSKLIDLNAPGFDAVLKNHSVSSVSRWLPHARKTDQDNGTYLNRFFVIKFKFPLNSFDEINQSLVSLPEIKSSESMAIIKLDYIPNDTRWSQQWGLEAIEADLAYDKWDIDGGQIPGIFEGGQIVVGVPDNGMQWNHPDLVDNIYNNLGEDLDGDGRTIEQSGNTWIFDPDDENGIDDDNDGFIDNFIGWDVGFGDNDPSPQTNQYDHGTLVAGCVSASTNNSTGIASIGWSVKILPVNASNDDQLVTDGYDAMLVAAQMGANVINCSWGSVGSGGGQSVINTVYNTYNCIVVASSGNGDENGNTNFDFHSPSGFDNVVSVTASNPNDNFACWATAGETIDLAAPGSGIMTTNVNSGYASVSGTSFSSPITAGAIALLWSRFPDASKETIISRILDNTDYYSDMDGECNGTSLVGMLGSGRLNINKALSSGVYPQLSVSGLNLQLDDDGDGSFNPGETVRVKIVIGNGAGWADAEDVVLSISSNDDRITLIDSVIAFSNNISSGASGFSFFDYILISSDIDAMVGPVLCNVRIEAGGDADGYVINEEVSINLTLNQSSFPIQDAIFKSSPIVADLNNNSIKEIYIGAEDDKLYGYTSDGQMIPGFPFSTGDRIRSSVAIGDVDNDGTDELVFGSSEGKLYTLRGNGSLQAVYTQVGAIESYPALKDIDDDGDLEIIFTTASSSGGKLYVIHHNGILVEGFPIELGSMFAGPAVKDLDMDGVDEIVVGTYDDQLWVIEAIGGAIKSGFPFEGSNRFNIPPTIADLDDDGYFEIISATDSGNLYVINHEGILISEYDTGDDIRGGISIADLNADASLDLIFNGYDDMVHAWSPISNQILSGWPIDLGSNIVSEPVVADMDGDGSLDVVVSRKNGSIYCFKSDGSLLQNFPINISGNTETTPVIDDLDGDGDLEIIYATTDGLQVFDIKYQSTIGTHWSMYRGGLKRNGVYDSEVMTVKNEKVSMPLAISVSSNFPNPFNPSTSIIVSSGVGGILNVEIYSISGTLVTEIYNSYVSPGAHKVTWDGVDANNNLVSSGLYYIKSQIGKHISTQKAALIK